jgi:hypothetical protein
MKINIAIVLLAASVFASCKSNSTSSSSNNNNNNGGGAPANTMYITANGKIDTLGTQGTTTTTSGNSVTTITGGNTFGTSCALTLENISTPGTYTVVAGGLSIPANEVGIVFITPDSYGDPERYTSATGTLTISSISTTAIQATFNASFFLQAGNGANRDTITNGVVNATIQ